MNLNNKKVLVTGGAGFIGSHLVDRLIKEKYRVVVIDNLSTGRKENLNPKAKFYKVDICSSKIKRILKKENPEVIFHYAAQVNIGKSMKNPIKDAKINILGSLNMIQNFVRINPPNFRKPMSKKFIFISSIGVFGEPKKIPVVETDPINPIAPYPIAKSTIEKYLNYYKDRGLDYISLRYANVYGPRQSTSGEGGVISIFIKQILNQKKPIIFGGGNQTRDFLYVKDAVSAAMKSIETSFRNTVYNIGTNQEITINDLLELISKKFNKKIEPVFRPIRHGEIMKSKISFKKIEKELGWQPNYNLNFGLEETIEWFKSNYKYEK